MSGHVLSPYTSCSWEKLCDHFLYMFCIFICSHVRSRVFSLYFLCQVTCSFPVFLFVPMLAIGHVFHTCILICSCANCITVPSCLSAHLSYIEKLSCTKLNMKLVHCLFMIYVYVCTCFLFIS